MTNLLHSSGCGGDGSKDLLRYSRNFSTITEEEFETLQSARVFVAGCGGLGGNLIMHLLRIGIGHITAIDGDSFEPTNLNRQLLCTMDTLSHPKAETAEEYAAKVNPDVDFTAIRTLLDETNADALIAGHDLVLDALDNIGSRRILAAACDCAGIPLIYGGICGWSAQVSVLPPGTAAARINQIYIPGTAISNKSCLSFTPAFCASVQTAEAVKLLLGKPSELNGNLLFADLLESEWELIPFFNV